MPVPFITAFSLSFVLGAVLASPSSARGVPAQYLPPASLAAVATDRPAREVLVSPTGRVRVFGIKRGKFTLSQAKLGRLRRLLDAAQVPTGVTLRRHELGRYDLSVVFRLPGDERTSRRELYLTRHRRFAGERVNLANCAELALLRFLRSEFASRR